MKKHKAKESDRVLLKQCVLALISNLCLDPTIRGWTANDMSGILSSVTVLFKKDLKDQAFDWLTSVTRCLNVMVNSAQETPAQIWLTDKDVIKDCDTLLKKLKLS